MSVKFNQRRGYWFVDTTWPDGMRTRVRMTDESTASKINMKIMVACNDEDRIWRKLRREMRLEGSVLQGFSALADSYYKGWVQVHNRSLRTKQSRLRILKAHFKAVPIDAISMQMIDGFIEARRNGGVENRTINRDMAVMNHLFEWAIDRGYFDANPAAKFRRLEEIEWIGARPDESSLDAIFFKLSETVRPVFVFLRETGCRREEAITLKRSQIDFLRATVTFHSNTKNGRSRQVPLTESALCAISSMPKRGETVFYHPDRLKHWTGDSVAIFWERAREAAGYSELRIHDLRHAYGIKLAERGCPMHFISEVMGHHLVDFTRKHYARFSPESASRAVLKVLDGGKAKTSEAG
jgi:integrase